MKQRPITPDIDRQVQVIAHQPATGGEGENYPAAVMIVPTVLKPKEFFKCYRLDDFLPSLDCRRWAQQPGRSAAGKITP